MQPSLFQRKILAYRATKQPYTQENAIFFSDSLEGNIELLITHLYRDKKSDR